MISPSSKMCPDPIGTKVILRGQAGMATGIVMLIAMIMAAIALGVLGLNREHTIRDIRYALFHSMLDVVNINLYAFGQNDRAFKTTLNHNYTNNGFRMSCIRNTTPCVIKVKQDIVLRYPTDPVFGSTYYDQFDPSFAGTRDGFRLDGSVCNYNSNAVADGCVLSVRVRWEPFCITDCLIPPNRMIFDITYFTPTYGANGERNETFLPVAPEAQNGPMPIFNPFR